MSYNKVIQNIIRVYDEADGLQNAIPTFTHKHSIKELELAADKLDKIQKAIKEMTDFLVGPDQLMQF